MQIAMPSERLPMVPAAGASRHLSAPAWLSLLLAPLLLIAAVMPTSQQPARILGLVAMTMALVVGQLLTLRHLAQARQRAIDADRLARLDPLTGLGNRRAMEEDLAREARRATRTGRQAALILFDLDGFKAVNDRLGHGRGDALLQAFSASIAGQTRADLDSAYRMGGDEFVVLLPEATAQAAQGAAQRIRAAFLPVAARLAPGLPVDCSVGVAALDHQDTDAWLAVADQRMYAHKSEGQKSEGHRPSPP